MTKPLIELRDVAIRYGRGARAPTIGPCSLQVVAGEIVALVGESGSGKSSLARVAAGLQQADQGTVLLGGEIAADLPRGAARALLRSVQMVFQDPSNSLNPNHTVARTIREPMVVRGLRDRAAMERALAGLMELLGLPERLLGAKPASLSGGQKQRVAIARALAMEPRVLVCDEALSALDVVNQLAVARRFEALRGQGLGMLMVSHDLGMVRRLADRVIVLRAGRIVEQGSVAQVLDEPADAYTRALVRATPDVLRGGLDLTAPDTLATQEILEMGDHP